MSGEPDRVADDVIACVRERVGESKSKRVLRYIGSDWPIKDEVLALLVESGCDVLVEVFGGSGVVSSLAPRDVFKVIVYNDIDGNLVNFFRVLKEKPLELQRALALVPYSRSVFEEYKRQLKTGELDGLDPVERAARYYYVLMCSVDGCFHGGFSTSIQKNEAREHFRKIASIPRLASMFTDVVVENLDFRKLIPRYDSSHTVFYCDPPFLSRKERLRYDLYVHAFREQDMRDLLELLENVKGKFVLKLIQDNYELPFVKEWVEKNRLSVTPVEHPHFSSLKKNGEEKGYQTTVLIHNYARKQGKTLLDYA